MDNFSAVTKTPEQLADFVAKYTMLNVRKFVDDNLGPEINDVMWERYLRQLRATIGAFLQKEAVQNEEATT